jgi:hypothetical protein
MKHWLHKILRTFGKKSAATKQVRWLQPMTFVRAFLQKQASKQDFIKHEGCLKNFANFRG